MEVSAGYVGVGRFPCGTRAVMCVCVCVYLSMLCSMAVAYVGRACLLSMAFLRY